MAKKKFKAESQRVLDLMINSIYTNRDIFLREIISNASDAIDKLCYLSLTDDKVGMTRDQFKIRIELDKDARTVTVIDNGIGMTKEEAEANLGVIAKSGTNAFRQDLDAKKADEEDLSIIGQFGVGFYSAFMVSDKVTVETRKYGEDTGVRWESAGADGYTVEEFDKPDVGTRVIMHIKPDTEEEIYSSYLETWKIKSLVKKYSDYVRWPIEMDIEHQERKETGEKDDQATRNMNSRPLRKRKRSIPWCRSGSAPKQRFPMKTAQISSRKPTGKPKTLPSFCESTRREPFPIRLCCSFPERNRWTPMRKIARAASRFIPTAS